MRQTVGITSGLAAGTQFANIYLLSFDLYNSNTLRSNLFFYIRYIDDALMILDKSVTKAYVLEQMNMFENGISLTSESEDRALQDHFLDLDIQSKQDGFTFKTYRKPQCLYMYLPFISNHNANIKKSVIMSELHRLRKTNDSALDFKAQCCFFRKKLRARGYPGRFIDDTFRKVEWNDKFVNSEQQQVTKRIVPFKLLHFVSCDSLGIAKTLSHHWKCSKLSDEVRPVVCYSGARNLFVRRFRRFI
eukprot:TRINITY_DN34844_c0_g1_i3.p1 TRINITY_DN34844_c0_g1~~TRINITY_DN34844_c0_g1_i3.p1  ORF type:complete len:246 (+),score=34.18 TRINITY_DN34844_c0_g1_i3:954-1691(+)